MPKSRKRRGATPAEKRQLIAELRTKRSATARRTDVEGFEFAGGSVIRDGRAVVLQTTSGEDHERFVADLLQSIPEVEASQKETLDRLDEVLAAGGPEAIVARASLTYLLRNADTYRESEDDRSPAHVEFLALRALPLMGAPGTANPLELATLTNEALSLVRAAFAHSAQLLNLRTLERVRSGVADPSFEEYRRVALLESLAIRGMAYEEHVRLIARGCLDPFDEACRQSIGFTVDEALRLIDCAKEVISKRLEPRLLEVAEALPHEYRELKRRRRTGELPVWLAGYRPAEQKVMIQQLLFDHAFREPVDLARLTGQDLAESSGISLEACESWLELMHCPQSRYVEEYHRAPVGGHPVTENPIIKIDGGYVIVAHTSLPEVLRARMEDGLLANARSAWDRYADHRGRWLEDVVTERIRRALPHARAWTGIRWESPEDDSDLDGLVVCDDLALRIQCKASRVSQAARRGAPSMVEDVTAVIADAARQHERLTNALAKHNPAVLGFDTEQALALQRPLTLEIIVCLDDVTIWSTEAHKLRHLVTLPTMTQVPWALSLPDLFATTDLLQGAEFVHYATRRQRLEKLGRVEAHDELDWVGNYIHDGLYFDDVLRGPDAPNVYRLMSFTEEIDSWYLSRAGLMSRPRPRPRQPLPPRLSSLLSRLADQRPQHWLTAALLLMNGDTASREAFDQQIAHTESRARQVGWSNASQVFPDYGVTLWLDGRMNAQGLTEMLDAYSRRKVTELGLPVWVAIGLGVDREVVIRVIEEEPGRTVPRLLLEPRLTEPQAAGEE